MKKRIFFIFVIFFSFFYLYLHCSCPAVGPEDSGEFSVSAYTLGIPHPPGYPVYTLLAKLWITLIPWANPGYKTNILSGFLSIISIFILYIILKTVLKFALQRSEFSEELRKYIKTLSL